MSLTDDILRKVRNDFTENDAPSIVEMLISLQRENSGLFCDRILRCILFVARGRVASVSHAVALARLDPRDLIVWAEYDNRFETQLRYFALPFSSHDLVPPDTKSV